MYYTGVSVIKFILIIMMAKLFGQENKNSNVRNFLLGLQNNPSLGLYNL